MDQDDREELVYRRIADKVAEAAEKQIKSRYFWAALLFAVASWFGGSALITGIVQSRVAEKMEPAQGEMIKATLRAEQLSVRAEQLTLSLGEAQKNAANLSESLKDTNKKLEDASNNEKGLEKQLEAIQSDARLAISQFNERIKVLGQVIAQIDSGQSNRETALAKLDVAQVVVRFGDAVPAEFPAQLAAKLQLSGKYSVKAEGGRDFIGASSLRYFYKEDDASAKELAQIATELLQQFHVDNKAIPIVNLSGLPIKPPERTFELWLNFSDGKLL